MTSNTSAPLVGQFNNIVTGGILCLVIGLIIGGLLLCFGGTLLGMLAGIIMVGLGAAIWEFGEVKHSPSNPKEVGVIMWWDRPVKNWVTGEEYIVVAGDVILAPYRPIKLTTVKVDISNKEKPFVFDVTSKDNVTFKAKVSLNTRADTNDLLDYIQAGNDMEKIFGQIDSIVEKNVRRLVSDANIRDILHGKADISTTLELQIHTVFETKSFGVVVIKAQFIPEISDTLADKFAGVVIEQLERDKELLDNQTMAISARILQKEYAKEHIQPGQAPTTETEWDEFIAALIANNNQIPSFDYCLNRIEHQRLIRDGKANYDTLDIIGGPGHQLIINGQRQRGTT